MEKKIMMHPLPAEDFRRRVHRMEETERIIIWFLEWLDHIVAKAKRKRPVPLGSMASVFTSYGFRYDPVRRGHARGDQFVPDEWIARNATRYGRATARRRLAR